MKTLRDRVAVVTGGASGIGLGMARAFAAQGAKLVLADVEKAALEKAVAGLEAEGAAVQGFACDVSDPTSVAELAEKTLEAFGAAHVLCNNAGVAGGAPGGIWEAPLEEWDWVLGVNLMGVIHGLRSFVPILLEQEEGHVVNTASMAGLMPGAGIYGVTKHGVVALSEGLWRDLRAREAKVGVSVLCPGWVRTRIAESDRNRPEAPREPVEVPPEAEMMRKIVEGFIERGKDPREVGDLVAQCILEDRFYVLTHPWESMVRARMEDIVEGRDPVGAPPPDAAEWSELLKR